MNDGDDNKGNDNIGDRNNGDRNNGDENNGNRNKGDRNNGNWNNCNWNNGNWNNCNWNNGNWNNGNWNNGNWNNGNWNKGDGNNGNWNNGDGNNGNGNNGNWNNGDENNGYFNTIRSDSILVFNKPCRRSAWDEYQKPHFFYRIEMTYWVDESKMTDDEKDADPDFSIRGGQLRTRTYHEAWRKAWDEASSEDRKLVEKLPNFDKDVFKEITGIDTAQETTNP